MSGFLSKTRQKVEHTGKINLGEFKLLGAVIGSEKNLLNSHVRVSGDCKKAAAAVDEWAQAEGVDLTDTIGKVAKLLGNDLARAEEEYADHVNSYRLYFKGLREREEKFSALKKNKNSLQGKIDSAEKKLAKMNPENKDLPNLTQKLHDLKSEMVGMEHSVINEDAAIADHRRHTARSAMAHKLGALCQLGEKMQIIGELGKLLVAEIPTQRTEPGYERAMYNSHERTQQIYGEAQTCLHGVKFDSSTNGEAQASSLPVPSRQDYDQSYEYEQDAATQREMDQEQRDSYEREQAYGYPGNLAHSDSQRLSSGTGQSGTIRTYEKPGSATTEQEPSRSYAPLTTDVQGDGDFSDSVNASWQAQHDQRPIGDVGATYAPATATIPEQEETPTESTLTRGIATGNESQQIHAPSAAPGNQSMDELSLDVPKDPSPALTMNTAPESTGNADEGSYLNRGMGNQVHELPMLQLEGASEASPVESRGPEHSLAAEATGYTPSGEDLSGTGLYGNQTESPTTEMTPTRADFPAEQLEAVPESGTTPTAEEPASIPVHDTSAVVMAPVPGSQPVVQPQQSSSRQVSSSSFSPPPGRPSGPAQSRAPPAAPSSSSMPQLPFPGAGITLGSGAPPVSSQTSSSKRQSLPPAPLQKDSYRSTSSSKTPPPASAPTSPNPGSPTRSKPTKQSSYSREPRQSLPKRQDSADAQRSSIAYLNDTPHIEPPMKAPPPVTSLGPLPSTSPYFNSYATLRSSSYGKTEPSPSVSASAGESAGRPRGSRSNSNSLGNKLGYDKKSSHSNQEKSLLQMPMANTNPSAVSNKDYSYAIYNDTGSGGRKLNAGAFRRGQPHRESSYMSAHSTGTDGTVSPAQRLRDEWRNSQIAIAPPAADTPSAYATPSSTPAAFEPSVEQLAAAEQGRQPANRDSMDMYGDRAQSSYLHRTSAVDAPTDVLPSDNYSHTSLNRLAEEGESEAVLPLNLRKRSVVSDMPDAPTQDSGQRLSTATATGPAGFNDGRYVTNLDE